MGKRWLLWTFALIFLVLGFSALKWTDRYVNFERHMSLRMTMPSIRRRIAQGAEKHHEPTSVPKVVAGASVLLAAGVGFFIAGLVVT
jgi:hypothetical protein